MGDGGIESTAGICSKATHLSDIYYTQSTETLPTWLDIPCGMGIRPDSWNFILEKVFIQKKGSVLQIVRELVCLLQKLDEELATGRHDMPGHLLTGLGIVHQHSRDELDA